MLNKKKFYIPFLIIATIALLFCVFSNLYVLVYSDLDVLTKIGVGISEIAVLSAIHYIIFGCKKENAAYFKAFLILFALSEVVLALVFGVMNIIYISLFLTLAFSLIVVLFCTKDFGKTNSMLSSGFICLVNLVTLLIAIFSKNSEILNKYHILITVCYTCLSIVLLVCMYAKYVDKSERHAKEQ